jgi:hypothetical protein
MPISIPESLVVALPPILSPSSRTFAELTLVTRLKGKTDHDMLPNVRRSLPDQAFDATQNLKKIQVHPTDLNKATSIAVNLDPT